MTKTFRGRSIEKERMIDWARTVLWWWTQVMSFRMMYTYGWMRLVISRWLEEVPSSMPSDSGPRSSGGGRRLSSSSHRRFPTGTSSQASNWTGWSSTIKLLEPSTWSITDEEASNRSSSILLASTGHDRRMAISKGGEALRDGPAMEGDYSDW